MVTNERHEPGALQEVSLPVHFAAPCLEELRAEGVRRLSELASLCIERLLALGRSVSASFRHGGANDGIRWPEPPEEKAAMLRFQVGHRTWCYESSYRPVLPRTCRSSLATPHFLRMCFHSRACRKLQIALSGILASACLRRESVYVALSAQHHLLYIA